MENIITLKQEELSQIFNEIEVNQSFIMSIFFLERLWIPFVFATKPGQVYARRPISGRWLEPVCLLS